MWMSAGMTALIAPAWMRWRYGERVCAVCGGDPVESISFPREYLVTAGLAHGADPWLVPVCGRHRRSSCWPTGVSLAMLDAHRDVSEGRAPFHHQGSFWDDTPPPASSTGVEITQTGVINRRRVTKGRASTAPVL